jgi:hypothetical protein
MFMKDEFENLSPEGKQKVQERLDQIMTLIETNGGWDDEMVIAMSFLVFNTLEATGFDVAITPRTKEAYDIVAEVDPDTKPS